MNVGIMNSCLVTRKENSIELEDYSFQWLTLLLPKLYPKNLNKTKNEEERNRLIFEWLKYVSDYLWSLLLPTTDHGKVRIFGVSGVGEDGVGRLETVDCGVTTVSREQSRAEQSTTQTIWPSSSGAQSTRHIFLVLNIWCCQGPALQGSTNDSSHNLTSFGLETV